MQAIEISKRVLDVEHSSTLVHIGNLASTYMSLGRWKEAEELETQAEKKRVKGC